MLWMAPFNFLISSLLTFPLLLTVAEIIPLVGRSPISATHFKRQQLEGGFGNGSVAVFNKGNLQYSCNITLAGREYNVIVDTGSNDLWVKGAPPVTKALGVSATLAYSIGTVSGSINTANLAFDTFQVPNQAYLLASKSTDLDFPEGNGMLGIGPSNSSDILSKLNGTGTDGLPLLDRIFRQNMNTPNFITLLLSRSQDDKISRVPLLDNHPGLLTIGEPVPQYEEILNMPKLKVPIDPLGQQHWQTVLDSNGIIGPDGKPIQTNTGVPEPRDGKPDQLQVVFDSGFSLPQISGPILDAIYGKVPGAKFIESEGLYSIPCEYELNITFLFSGKEYPIAPLDLSINATLDDGTQGCFSHFQKAPDDIRKFGAIDAILGMAFLRNTYVLINFGDFVGGSDRSVADPYIQLLSTVNKTAAHLDFVNARLGGKDTTGSQAPLTGSTGNGNGNGNNNGSVPGKNNGTRRNSGLVGGWWFAICVILGIVAGI
ncbi:hypothetical protein E1B28_004915 [Marasmius oreades]|uniref:Peptidase A1 domain-containing protein n=1 Tax=Marasmius oreades TaxID=181124 RepID=A0A9P7UZP0_9AGAR|nr:uncharacterized protein E1B28_004915 [Marasmius oreades]KAG7097578.1 hypothetical protein E1B28_004915 [Marasmius oreades]